MVWIIGVGIALGLAVFSHRYRWWRSPVPDSRPRILMYHMVAEHRPGAAFNKLRVPPARFEEQVKWLADHGYYFALMSELANPDVLPDKSVAITFDDGYEDNYLNAHPVLVKYRARATLYLVEDRFDRDWSVSKKSHHDSGELKAEAKLKDDQVVEMIASGVWELGGHTATHANLNKIDSIAKGREIGGSKKRLEQKFGVRLSSFAYPFGIFTEDDIPYVKEAGYDTAVSTIEGIDVSVTESRFALKRIKISGKDGKLAFLLRMRTGKRG